MGPWGSLVILVALGAMDLSSNLGGPITLWKRVIIPKIHSGISVPSHRSCPLKLFFTKENLDQKKGIFCGDSTIRFLSATKRSARRTKREPILRFKGRNFLANSEFTQGSLSHPIEVVFFIFKGGSAVLSATTCYIFHPTGSEFFYYSPHLGIYFLYL